MRTMDGRKLGRRPSAGKAPEYLCKLAKNPCADAADAKNPLVSACDESNLMGTHDSNQPDGQAGSPATSPGARKA